MPLLQQSNPLMATYPRPRERLEKRQALLALCQHSPFTQNRKNQPTTINLRMENNNDKAEKNGVADHDDQQPDADSVV